MKPPSSVSVCIPTFNGAPLLRETLDAILAQQLPSGCDLDLLVIDSGSTDDTLAILRRYEERLRLYEIPNHEFNHGGTRDRAARLAKGEFVLFLSQDATPAHERWLVNLIEPFYLSDRVGCVYGAQWPRRDAPVTIRREVTRAFSINTGDIILSRAGSMVDGALDGAVDPFFSDVNSAARRDLLIGAVPFRHLNYAEDHALALDMQQHGYLKAYAPRAAVWHSNDYGCFAFYGRKFDEYRGLALSTGSPLVDSVPSLLLGWVKPTLLDWSFIFRTHEYTTRQKLLQVAMSPAYNIANKAGRHFAARHLQRKRSTPAATIRP